MLFAGEVVVVGVRVGRRGPPVYQIGGRSQGEEGGGAAAAGQSQCV